MFRKSIWICVALVLSTLNDVLSQPDLCQNPKIDSITYIENNNMWFFTSGGYYWVIKDSENLLPKKENAKKLPQGFKVGDAAVYRNTLTVCGTQTQNIQREIEILLVEKQGSANNVIVYDLREDKWKPPTVLANDRILGQAQIDKIQTIDAMFVREKAEIYLVQGKSYAAVDYMKLCSNPSDYATAFEKSSINDFNFNNHIDAMTKIKNNNLLLFSGSTYLELRIIYPQKTPGKINAVRIGSNVAKSIANEFFKCNVTESGPTPGVVVPTPEPPTDNPEPSKDTGLQTTSSSPGEEKSGVIFIILGVVAAVVVVIVIALIVVIAMCKKKSGADSEADGMAASGAEVSAGAAGKSSIDGKVGGSKVGSKVDSKVGSQVSPSKTGSKMTAPSSLGGTSPSKMSVRSMM
jgi:hypothetical protein